MQSSKVDYIMSKQAAKRVRVISDDPKEEINIIYEIIITHIMPLEKSKDVLEAVLNDIIKKNNWPRLLFLRTTKTRTGIDHIGFLSFIDLAFNEKFLEIVSETPIIFCKTELEFAISRQAIYTRVSNNQDKESIDKQTQTQRSLVTDKLLVSEHDRKMIKRKKTSGNNTE